MKHILTLVAATSFTTLAPAQTQRDLESHEHGSAALNIAMDAGAVFIEMKTPWDNIIGFEHAPETDTEHALLKDALSLLNQPEKLFTFNGTDCTIHEMAIEHGLGHRDDHEDHKDHEDHEDHDNHENNDNHKEDEHHHEEEASSHSTVLATYEFDCDSTGGLSEIEVTLLSLWSGFESLSVQMIGPGGQGLTTLSPEKMTIDVAPIR